MSRKIGDPAKVAEAKAALEAGKKALATSMLKWKPDYLAAEPKFQEAGRLFKQAGLFDSAVDAWKQAIECSIKMNNMKQAVITLETTARELTAAAGRDTAGNAYKEAASAMLAEAAQILHELNESGRAADFKLRAGKLLEGFNNAAAAKHYDDACKYFDGEEDKDVYAKEALSKALGHQLGLGKHASAMKTMDKLSKIFVRLNQPHNLYKLILSRIILLLAAGDPVAAQAEFDKHLDAMEFVSSAEAGAAEDIIFAATNVDEEAMKKAVSLNVINYLDHSVAAIAKKLPSTIMTGKSIGAAHADEMATKAVSYETRGTVGGMRIIGGGSGFSDPADTATATAAVSASKHSSDRAALFSKPVAPKAPVPEPEAPVAPTEEAEDYDYEAAFKALGVDDGSAAAAAGDGEHHHVEFGVEESKQDTTPGDHKEGDKPAAEAPQGDELGIW